MTTSVVINCSMVSDIPTTPYTDKGKNQSLQNLARLVHGLSGGVLQGVVSVHTSTNAAVAASGTITLTFANINAAETVTIGGVVLTARASGAVAGTEFNILTNATVTAANLTTAINANTTLNKHVTATSAAGVVTVTANLRGSLGNLIVMSTNDATAFALVQMAGGTGGPETAAVVFA
jgi:phage tail sheath gpL-like